MIQKKEIVIKSSNGEDVLYRLEIPPVIKTIYIDSKSAASFIFRRYIGIVDELYPESISPDLLHDLYSMIENNPSAIIKYYVADELASTFNLTANTYLASKIVEDPTDLHFICEEIEITNFKERR